MINACLHSHTVKFCERQFLYKAVQFMWEISEKRKPERLWWTYRGVMSVKDILSILCAFFDLLSSFCIISSGILLTDALYVTSVGHVTVSVSSSQLSLACGTALQSTIRDHRLNTERMIGWLKDLITVQCKTCAIKNTTWYSKKLIEGQTLSY